MIACFAASPILHFPTLQRLLSFEMSTEFSVLFEYKHKVTGPSKLMYATHLHIGSLSAKEVESRSDFLYNEKSQRKYLFQGRSFVSHWQVMDTPDFNRICHLVPGRLISHKGLAGWIETLFLGPWAVAKHSFLA